MRSVFSRFRLHSHAAMVPRRLALPGSTLLTMKTSLRRLPTASATMLSASPSPYISAVSISVTPRSSPWRSAATSSLRRRALSAIRQVPSPKVGTVAPEGRRVVGMEDVGICGLPLHASVRSAYNMTAAASIRLFMRDLRRPMSVERLDGFQPPGLALLAFFLGPGDRLPVGGQDQPRTGIRHFDAVAARLIDVEEERLLHRVLVRAGFDEDAVFQEHIGGEQHFLARIERVGDVVEAAGNAGVITRIGEVVALVGRGEPHAGFPPLVEHHAPGE